MIPPVNTSGSSSRQQSKLPSTLYVRTYKTYLVNTLATAYLEFLICQEKREKRVRLTLFPTGHNQTTKYHYPKQDNQSTKRVISLYKFDVDFPYDSEEIAVFALRLKHQHGKNLL